MLWLLTLLLVANLFWFPSTSLCAAGESRRELGLPLVQQHVPKDYSAGSQVFDVAVDSLGLIYACAGNEVVIYDGARYRRLVHPERKPPRTLVQDGRGRVWVGFRGDIGYLAPDDRGDVQLHTVLPDSILKRGVWDLWYAESLADTVFFASERALYIIWPSPENREQHIISTMHTVADSINNGFFRHDGKVFVTRNKRGFFQMSGGQLREAYRLSSDDPGIIKHGIPFDEKRALLTGYAEGLYLYDGESLTPFSGEIQEVLQGIRARYLTRLDSHMFAVSTIYHGVYIFDREGNILRHLDRRSGLSEDKTAYVCTDHQGGLWIATNYGFNRVDVTTPIQTFDAGLGLEGSTYALVRFGDVLYLGGSSGLYRLVPSEERGVPAHFERVEEVVDAVWELNVVGDHLLVGTVGATGIVSLPGHRYRKIHDRTLYFTLASANTADEETVFLGTFQNGIQVARRTAKGALQPYLEIPTKPFPQSMVYQEEDHRIWSSVDDQYIQRVDLTWRDGQVTDWTVSLYDTTKGLPPDRYSSELVEGRRLWGGDEGLYRYDEGSDAFVHDAALGEEFATGQREMTHLTACGDSVYWFNDTGQYGFRLTRQADGSFVEDAPLHRMRPQSIQVFYCEGDGAVWMGGTGGMLYRYDSQTRAPSPSPVKALVRSVLVRGDSLIYGGVDNPAWQEPVLAFRDNSLRFEYALPHYADPKLNEFQYRLIGLNEAWSEWTEETYRDFNSLRGGDYNFEVRGRDATGEISERDSFGFRVLPPWYATPWAFAGYALAGGLLVLLIVRFSIQRIERDRRRLAKLVDQKTAEALAQFERAKSAEIKARETETANRLAATIAHEFNNPLAIIQGCVDTIEMGELPEEKQRDYNQRIRKQVSRMSDLVVKLLALNELRTIDYAAGMKILDIHTIQKAGPEAEGPEGAEDEGQAGGEGV